jgi:uncharacterized iron-regulated membrane protein
MMTATIDTTGAPAPKPVSKRPDRIRQRSGLLLRRIWRYHFYSALFAGPFLVMLAITGLVILYTQPIHDLTESSLRKVTPSISSVPLDQQVKAAQLTHEELSISQVIPPEAVDRPTTVELTDGADYYLDVFVNPYTGKVLGEQESGNDIVGISTRLHGWLNNEAVTVTLPSLSHLINPANPATVEIPLGDVIVEIAAIWGLVLALSGVYLWWPRKSQHNKPLFKVRWSKGGRLRWRDLHSSVGIVLALILAFFILSGMPWSRYWGGDFSTAASKVTPNKEVTAPTSATVTTGDVDRFGHRIPWATREDPAALSGGPTTAQPARMSWSDISRVATAEGMLPGYSILPPADSLVDPAKPEYGAFVLSNPWPGRVQDEKVVYVDQFTGRTLATSSSAEWGKIQQVTEWGVQNHMGTQYGLITRIIMTLGCVLTVVSFVTSIVLWWKRRPKGTTGLPKRQARSSATMGVGIIALVLAVMYPLWGASLIAVLVVDGCVQLIRARRRPQTEVQQANSSETVTEQEKV